MKNLIPLFIASVFSFNGIAQKSEPTHNTAKTENVQSPDSNSENDLASVESYHVEERINVAFGSRIITYDVSRKSQISTTDLGRNNTRIITPRYAKTALVNSEVKKAPVENPTTDLKPIKIEPVDAKQTGNYAYIDFLKTYERVLEKGYRSADMIRKVANGLYFDGDLPGAARWYCELFDMTPNLGAEYYFRYAQSLKSIGQIEKSKEMMKIFEEKK